MSVYEAVLNQVKEGVRMCDVYNAALDLIEKQKPELKDHFTRSIGYAVISSHITLQALISSHMTPTSSRMTLTSSHMTQALIKLHHMETYTVT